MEAADTTKRGRGGAARSQKPTSQATIVRTLAKLNHVATDTVSTCRVEVTCSTAASVFKCKNVWRSYNASYSVTKKLTNVRKSLNKQPHLF